MYIEPCYKQELSFILNNIHLYYKTAHNLKQGKFFWLSCSEIYNFTIIIFYMATKCQPTPHSAIF